MAGKLRRLPDEVTLTCERFEVLLEDGDHAAFAADPEGYMRDLLAREGAPAPNGVVMPAAFRDSLEGVGTLVFLHVKAPASERSNYISFPPMK